MHRLKRLFASTLTVWILLYLTGCASMSPPAAQESTVSWETRKTQLSALQSWHINGKIAVITAEDSGSASVDWLERQGNYTISMYGPLGANGLTMKGGPGQVTLKTSDGKTVTAASAEALLAQQWGWKLPLSYLKYWVRGLPVPNLPAQSRFDAAHRLASLNQQGFTIQYQGYTSAGTLDLPQHLSISSPSLKSKIVIYKWNIS